MVDGRSYYLQRRELNLVAPLATVIKQRVRCTEAKLIWSFDDKRTTFILPSHRPDGRKGKEGIERRTERDGGMEEGMRSL